VSEAVEQQAAINRPADLAIQRAAMEKQEAMYRERETAERDLHAERLERETRTVALQIAASVTASRSDPDDTLAAARDFYAFLTGDARAAN
jgi:hypothetical protein